jgi:hypothetical protein
MCRYSKGRNYKASTEAPEYPGLLNSLIKSLQGAFQSGAPPAEAPRKAAAAQAEDESEQPYSEEAVQQAIDDLYTIAYALSQFDTEQAFSLQTVIVTEGERNEENQKKLNSLLSSSDQKTKLAAHGLLSVLNQYHKQPVQVQSEAVIAWARDSRKARTTAATTTS